jgi:hypothetical protein
MSTSFFTWLLQLFHHYWVAANHVLVVRRYGNEIRFGRPGLVWVNPVTEDVAGVLYVGFRKVDVNVAVQSADSLTIHYTVRVFFVFDPRGALPAYRRSITMQVLAGADALEQMIYAFLGEALREDASNQPGLALISGVQTASLARTLEKQLAARFAELGVQLKSDLAITIHPVNAPHSLLETAELIAQREALSQEFSMPVERLEAHILMFRLFDRLATHQGPVNFFVLPGGIELLPPQIVQQLMGGPIPGHRRSGASRPQHRYAPPADSVIDHDSS